MSWEIKLMSQRSNLWPKQQYFGTGAQDGQQ